MKEKVRMILKRGYVSVNSGTIDRPVLKILRMYTAGAVNYFLNKPVYALSRFVNVAELRSISPPSLVSSAHSSVVVPLQSSCKRSSSKIQSVSSSPPLSVLLPTKSLGVTVGDCQFGFAPCALGFSRTSTPSTAPIKPVLQEIVFSRSGSYIFRVW